MPIFVHELEDAVTAAVVQVQNARVELLKKGVPTELDSIAFTVEMIREKGEGALKLKSITATPKRVSRTETPEVIEENTQTVGPSTTNATESGTQNSTANSSESSNQTTSHGRETQVEVEYKE